MMHFELTVPRDSTARHEPPGVQLMEILEYVLRWVPKKAAEKRGTLACKIKHLVDRHHLQASMTWHAEPAQQYFPAMANL